ncbi:MAG: hypothetical protein NTU83_13860 [Candidatus Hydrogenedentes bacterium]|nr:hypothetical protein [Candidatus Hydrogenedentota bacterium]
MHTHRDGRKKEWYRKRKPQAKRRRPAPISLGGGGRLYYLLIALAAILVAGYIGYRYLSEDTEEKHLRELVYAAQRAVEAKNVPACLSLLDETYTDNQHNDYKSVQRRALHELDHVDGVRLGVRNIAVEIVPNADQAHVQFEIRFRARVDDGTGQAYPVAGVLGNHVPIGAVWERVRLECVKRGNDWRISYAAIESLKG